MNFGLEFDRLLEFVVAISCVFSSGSKSTQYKVQCDGSEIKVQWEEETTAGEEEIVF